MTTGESLIQASDLAAKRAAKYQGRNRINKIAIGLSLAAMAFGVFWLVWILWETLRLGIGGLSIALLTEMTPAPTKPAVSPTPSGARSSWWYSPPAWARPLA